MDAGPFRARADLEPLFFADPNARMAAERVEKFAHFRARHQVHAGRAAGTTFQRGEGEIVVFAEGETFFQRADDGVPGLILPRTARFQDHAQRIFPEVFAQVERKQKGQFEARDAVGRFFGQPATGSV
jgi:hypothetical protein